MARQEGLEPPAYCLEGSCSIQLSYWRIRKIPVLGNSLSQKAARCGVERVMGIEPTCSAWKADILPLNYTRGRSWDLFIIAGNSRPVNHKFSDFVNFFEKGCIFAGGRRKSPFFSLLFAF